MPKLKIKKPKDFKRLDEMKKRYDELAKRFPVEKKYIIFKETLNA